jgi:hypothetical protein
MGRRVARRRRDGCVFIDGRFGFAPTNQVSPQDTLQPFSGDALDGLELG